MKEVSPVKKFRDRQDLNLRGHCPLDILREICNRETDCSHVQVQPNNHSGTVAREKFAVERSAVPRAKKVRYLMSEFFSRICVLLRLTVLCV